VFIAFIRDGDRISRVVLIRDTNGSRLFEEADDLVVQQIMTDQNIRLGDGNGATHNFPDSAIAGVDAFGLGFGPRGEARHPTTGAVVSGFINVSHGNAERGGVYKFSNIRVSPAGSVTYDFHRVAAGDIDGEEDDGS